MRTKIAALVMASVLVAPMGLFATEPNADVAKAIAEIAARREAKAEAAAKAAAQWKGREGKEGGAWVGGQAGGAVIQLGR